MVFLCSCGGLIWDNRVHVCGSVRCSCGAIKFNGRGHCCGYTPDYSVPPTDWELYSGYRSFDEWMGSTTWGKRSPSLFNTKNQEKCILNTASSMEDIKNLRQTGSFQDYCKSFDLLLTKVILSEDYASNLFVEGLNSEIKGWVKFLGPKALKEAYEMANKHNNFLTFLNSAKEVKKVVDPSVSVDFDEKVSIVDVKQSLDDKNGDVIDLEEEIKENVKEMLANVIDDDVDVKKIEKESDDDDKQIEKEPVVDVKRFEWKPSWLCCSNEKLGIVQHCSSKHDVQVSIAWAFCNTLFTEFTYLNELIKMEPWLPSSKWVVKLDMLLGNCRKRELVALNLELTQDFESMKVCLGKKVEMEGCKGPTTTFIVEPFVTHNKEYPEPIHKKVIFLSWPDLKLKMGEDVEIVQHENALNSNLLLLLWKDRCTWHHKWKAKDTVENLDIHKATKLNHGMLQKAASGLVSKATVAAELGSKVAELGSKAARAARLVSKAARLGSEAAVAAELGLKAARDYLWHQLMGLKAAVAAALGLKAAKELGLTAANGLNTAMARDYLWHQWKAKLLLSVENVHAYYTYELLTGHFGDCNCVQVFFKQHGWTDGGKIKIKYTYRAVELCKQWLVGLVQESLAQKQVNVYMIRSLKNWLFFVNSRALKVSFTDKYGLIDNNLFSQFGFDSFD